MYFYRCATAQNVEIKILAKTPCLIHKETLGEENLWIMGGEGWRLSRDYKSPVYGMIQHG